MKLTTALVLPKGKDEHTFWDDTLTGFGLRLRRGAGDRVLKGWIVMYRAPGHQRRMTFADAAKITASEARKRAKKLLSEVELGGDPQGDRKDRREKDDVTLRSVIKDFLDAKTGVKAGTKQGLANYLLGPLGRRAEKRSMSPYLEGLHRMSIDRVTRKDIAACLLRVSKQSGEPTAIALRSALNSLFDWAMQMGLAESNPVIGSFKPPKQASRDRVLNDSELAMIWKALAGDDYGRAIRLLVCTGCRRAEVGGMRWSEFSPDMSTWTLPPSRSKTGKAHTLPLTPLMREVIATVDRRDGHDNLFGRKQFTGWAIGKSALDEKLGLRPWVTHDLRRSVATGMANIGVQPHIIECVLNHQSGHRRGVAGTYNRSPYERESRDAMLRWSDHISALIEGRESKVVAFERAAVTVTP
jgi:integrase